MAHINFSKIDRNTISLMDTEDPSILKLLGITPLPIFLIDSELPADPNDLVIEKEKIKNLLQDIIKKSDEAEENTQKLFIKLKKLGANRDKLT